MGKHSSEDSKNEKKEKKEKIKSPLSVAATAGKAKRKEKKEKKEKRSRSKGEGAKAKRIVHIGAPKKPETAYNLFAAKRRGELSTLFPTLTFAQLSKEVGRDWKLLLDADRAPFESAAKIAHDAYIAEKKAWEVANGITPSEKKRAKAE